MKRLVLHILPKEFKKTRFYEFMANKYKSSMLVLCRMLLGNPILQQEEIEKKFSEDTDFFSQQGLIPEMCSLRKS